MLSLEKNQKFIDEFNKFQSEIEMITDEVSKNELFKLLNNLRNKVRLFDKQHGELTLNNRLSAISVDTRQEIIQIRKTLHKRILECKLQK